MEHELFGSDSLVGVLLSEENDISVFFGGGFVLVGLVASDDIGVLYFSETGEKFSEVFVLHLFRDVVHEYSSFLDSVFVFLQFLALEKRFYEKLSSFENVGPCSDKAVKLLFVRENYSSAAKELLFNTSWHIGFEAWHFNLDHRSVAKIGHKVVFQHS